MSALPRERRESGCLRLAGSCQEETSRPGPDDCILIAPAATDALAPTLEMPWRTPWEDSMNPGHDGGRMRMDRRAALTILAGAGAALKIAVPSAAQAQSARTFNPAQVLNGADARVFPADIASELKPLATNVYAYLQLQPPGW